MMSELIDSMVIPGIQGGPLMHVIAAKAVGFGENLLSSYHTYAEQIIKNAKALAAALMARGFNIISGGTDNHLMLIDLHSKKVNGKEAQEALDLAGMTVNKNAVPFDDQSPLITSGIRIGTPAMTTRGMKEAEMELIAGFIDRVISDIHSESVIQSVQKDVHALTAQFPLYDELP
jgi:glycine hydroxymethyltransferase